MEAEIQAQRPEIFRYLDYRNYLSDFFGHLVALNRKYSRRWVALKAGLKSPQLISMILSGQRNLSRENAQLLAMALKLSEKEEEYLMILIELESAVSHERQMEILDRIRFQFQNGLFRDLPDSGFEYIKKWYYPAVRELVMLKHLTISSKQVAQALAISEAEATDALSTLTQMGFLRDAKGCFERCEPSVRAADYVSPLLMAQYHLQLLERAFQAIQLKREFRHFDSLVVALSSRDFDMVREKIRQLIREIDMLAESSARRDDIYQLSIQFFSLTGGRAREAAT